MTIAACEEDNEKATVAPAFDATSRLESLDEQLVEEVENLELATKQNQQQQWMGYLSGRVYHRREPREFRRVF